MPELFAEANLLVAGICAGLVLLASLAAGSLLTPAPALADPPQVETAGTGCPPFNPDNPELCGVISLPDGGDVSYFFELGLTSAYGSEVPTPPGEISIPPGGPPVAVTAPVDDLQPETTYHYRLVAVTDEGNLRGGDVTFQTPAAPNLLQVETGPPSCPAFNPGSPELCGVISLSGGGEVQYYFELGMSPGYGEKISAAVSVPAGGSVAVSAPLSGLQAGVKYHYRLAANAGEGTHFGADATFAMPVLEGGPVVEVPVVGGGAGAGTSSAGASNSSWLAPVAVQQVLPAGQPLVSALKRCRKQPKQRRPACRQRVRHRYFAARGGP